MGDAIAAALSGQIRIAATRGTATCRTHWFVAPSGGKSMRWKISHRHHHGGHDPRQIDLVAIAVLLIVIAAAFKFYSGNTDAPSTSDFIVPSQTVRW
jgi:hypothetical protein